jgi:uncharacterized protein YtpQ (UPF0354 family)
MSQFQSPIPTDHIALHADQLVPRIKHKAFAHALAARGVPRDQMPLMQLLCGDLLVTYAFDLPDGFRMATAADIAAVGVTKDELYGVTFRNVIRTVPEPKYLNRENVHLMGTGQQMETSMLVIDGIWDLIQPQLKGPILVSAPRRDRLLVCDGADAQAIAALRRQTAEYFNEHDDEHRLSTQIMRRQGDDWVLYDEQ